MIYLTRKQRELLQFIRVYSGKNDGVAPSFDEMQHALGLKSKSGVHRLITGLEERGHIRRMPHRARALEVVSELGDTDRLTEMRNRLLAKLSHLKPEMLLSVAQVRDWIETA